MIAFYEPVGSPHDDSESRRWRKWRRDNATKRRQLDSRLQIAIRSRNKTTQRQLEVEIAKIDALRFE